MVGLSSFLAVVLAAGLWAVLREDEYVAPSPDRPAGTIRPGAAAAVLQELVEAIRTGDARAATELAPPDRPAAARRLGALVRTAEAIPVRDVSLRYVDELGASDEGGEWRAAADLGWRYGAADPSTSEAEVEVRFATDGDDVSLVALGGPHGRQPVWVTGRLEVRHGPRTLVVATDEAAAYERLARRAVTVVHRVVPDWRSRLVVEVPRSPRALDRALAADRGAFANVAGVTAVPDGVSGPGEPVHVFLNPGRMADLRPRGAQVVVSHEAAHVALGATESSLPVWLTEGFADYVALRDVDLPVTTTASQVIAQVRRDGPPGRLPDADDFDEDSEYFGAAYEAAWWACRLLADRVGEEALLRFYRRADGAGDFGRLFRATFGSSVAGFTREWRRSLSDLAG